MAIIQYPGTNFHDLNLDWVLEQVKNLLTEWGETRTDWENLLADNTEFKSTLESEWDSFHDYIISHIDEDVPAEVVAEIDRMASDGRLLAIITADPTGEGSVLSDAVGEWLSNNITPTTPAVDASLTVSGAAADSWTVGNDIRTLLDTAFYKYKEPGKNLFNKDTTNYISGVYIDSDGKAKTLSSWKAFVVPINNENSNVSFSTSSLRAVFCSVIPDITSISVGDTVAGYISGVADTQTTSIPASAKAVIISCSNSVVPYIQVEYGTQQTTYEAYYETTILNKNIMPIVRMVGTNEDYQTIQSAIDAANDGDIIFIRNGTYDEAVDAQSGNKFLTIVGESRDGVVVTHDFGDYLQPPLEIAKGFVKNISFIATGDTATNMGGSYAVHIDYSTEANSSLQFVNCRFNCRRKPAVGIGLRENFKLSFVDCVFESRYGNAFYCHEQQASNKTGQYIELINCSIYTYGAGYAMTIQETPEYTGNECTIRMQRTIVKNHNTPTGIIHATQYGTEPGLTGTGYLGTSCWTLDEMSALNSDSILNA